MKLLAKTFEGLEEVLAKEIADLGGKNIKIVRRGVEYEGDEAVLYNSNLSLRSALSVLLHLKSGKISSADNIYDFAKMVDWPALFKSNKSISINVSGKSPFFKNSMYAAQKVKDAIADIFREQYGERPSINKKDPDVVINIYLNRDRVDFLLDSSGAPLFKRGYRVFQHRAPMNECLAAGLVLKSKWNKEDVFIDPFCGSGTIAIEAALYATNTPPNLNRRHFSFRNWRGYKKETFIKVYEKAEAGIKPFHGKILAGDQDPNIIRKSRKNMVEAGMIEYIKPMISNFFDFPLEYPKGIIVTNPPYNERLKIKDPDFYKKIGDTLKNKFKGFEAFIFTSDLEGIKSIGLSTSYNTPMYNGKLRSTFKKFELY